MKILARRIIRLGLLVLALSTLGACHPDQVFTVDTINDTVDANIGDSTCSDLIGDCSLRAAIQEANASAGLDRIVLAADTTYPVTIAGTTEDLGASGDLDITGPTDISGTNSTIDGGSLDRIIDVHSGAQVDLASLVLTGGSLSTGGGGGALRITNASVGILASRIHDNTSTSGGGGIHQDGDGGVTLLSTTIDTNTGETAGGLNAQNAWMVNTTISNNAAATGPGGAAIATGTLSYTTITQNTGGGLGAGPEVVIESSVIGDQTTGPDCTTPPTSTDYNLDTDNTCGLTQPNDHTTEGALLAPLDTNPTPSHLPYEPSPAVDAIPPGAAQCGTGGITDQLGTARPQNTNCDIGAIERPPSPQPNIVVIMTDDQWVDSMWMMTQTNALLVDQGTTFADSVVSNSTCCPSRATYLTGQYTHNNGVAGLLPDPGVLPLNGGYAALDAANSLPVWLTNAGYTTAHIGKFLNTYGDPAFGNGPRQIPAGWSEWYATTDPTTYYYNDFRQNQNGELVCYGTVPGNPLCDRTEPTIYSTDHFSTQATDFIATHADEPAPFFLNVAPLAPHAELPHHLSVPATRHLGTFSALPAPSNPSINEADVSDKPSFIQAYPPADEALLEFHHLRYLTALESLLAVDEMVASILTELDNQGILDDTIIIFTSDNGLTFGDHRLNTGKYDLYEGGIRVPLVIRGGDFPAGETSLQPAVNADLAPTIAALAHATPTHTVDGRDLLPNALDPTIATQRDILLATGHNQKMIDAHGHEHTAIRADDYKYAEQITSIGTEYELYNLATDPYELDNLAGNPTYSAIQADLAARLATLRTCAGSTCP